MIKTLISLLLVSLLSGCASLVPSPSPDEPKLVKNESKPEIAQNDEDNEDGDLIDNEMPVNNYDSRLKVRHEEYKNLKNEKKVEAKITVAHGKLIINY